MADFNKDPVVVPFFYITTVPNPAKTKEAGRPIFDEMEMVEVRLAGERNFAPHFPAHSMWIRDEGEEITYAMRWPDEYAQFKRGDGQVASGTPLDELTFLTKARVSELKALKIYTVEALAALEGPNLKVLAGEGYQLKEQAQAYMDKAHGHSRITSVAAENAELKAQLEMLREQFKEFQSGAVTTQQIVDTFSEPQPMAFGELTDDQLKDMIANKYGRRPSGNPKRETLLNMLSQENAA